MGTETKQIHEGYKMTELGEIPNEWEVNLIGNIVNVTKLAGFEFTEYMKYTDDGEIIALRALNLKNGKLKLDDIKKICRDISTKLPRSQLRSGDLLFSYVGTIGEMAIIEENDKYHLAPNVAKLTCKLNDITPKYLLYYLLSYYGKKEINKYLTTTSQPALSMSNIRALKVIVPPLDEQQKIAEILSTVDEQIENTEKLIKSTKELKKGLMQQLLTKGIGHKEFKDTEIGRIPIEWEVTTVGSLASFIGSGITPKGGRSVYQNEGVLFIRSQNVHFLGIRLEDIAYISDEIDGKMKRTRVFENDVLLNITGASIGRCTVVPFGFPRANVNQHVCIIRAKKELYPYFLNSYLSSPLGQQQIFKQQLGQTREGLNFQQIREFKIVVPSIIEQQKIAEILSSVDDEIESYEQQKAKYTELKKGLMQQLLTGRIRVTV
ncbi:restriction endonuclease subunit S [Bacillus dakarensis]|uniref:restriction endonuclease subunit S n=1 Tax=Robertmurraya dakarensis TaxID=1926278 RepID=UPI0009821573|nr:restriction endonuclease subunit S [Bacillus dakarensis]